jgi:hypothetical protein
MHPRATVSAALEFAASGMNATEVARVLGIPRPTVRDWLNGSIPRRDRVPRGEGHGPGYCTLCDGPEHRFAELSPCYVYLLGLYLGDGCISVHPRSVYKLRIVLDVKYPGIIEGAASTMSQIRGGSTHVQRRRDNCVEVSAYWKSWPCFLPQHGKGNKYDRSIVLTEWQQQLVERWPQELLKGLIHSDGCRFQNTGRCDWSWPRYSFAQRSSDICSIFCDACDRLGIHWTATRSRQLNVIYVSRKADVATLDRFIGPKQ